MKNKTSKFITIALSVLMLISLLPVIAMADNEGNTYYLSDHDSYNAFLIAVRNSMTDTFIIDTDLTIAGQSLGIYTGVTVIINAGVTFEMLEYVYNDGTFINNGTIRGDNELIGSGTFVNNGEICLEDGRLRIFRESTFTNNGTIDVYTIYGGVTIDNHGGSVKCSYFYEDSSANIGGINNYGGFVDVFYFEGTVNNYGGTLKLYAGPRTIIEWKSADYTALDKALAAAGKLDESLYAPGRWAALSTAVETAEAIERVEGWILEAAQNSIDEAAAAVSAAIDALVVINFHRNDFSSDADFFNAVANGKPGETYIFSTYGSTTLEVNVPSEVTLVFPTTLQSSFTFYGAVINNGVIEIYTHGAIRSNGILYNYGTITVGNWFVNTGTINNYGSIVIDAEFQNAGTVNNYGGTIKAGVNMVLPDFTVLNAALAAAAMLDETDYTAESWDVLAAAVAAGEAVEPVYGWIVGGTIENAAGAILAAISTLIEKPCVNGHDYKDNVITAPTCESEGLTVITCPLCDYRDEIVLEKLEHVYGDGDVTAPTCTDGGYTTFTCKLCSYSYIEDEAAAQPCGDCDLCITDVTITGVAGAKFVEITETSKNSREWRLTFNVAVIKSDGFGEEVQYSIILKGNNANLDGVHVFETGHDLAGYTLTYDIKGNGSNIKAFSIM